MHKIKSTIHILLLSLALLSQASLAASNKIADIEAAYFNSEDSIILETSDSFELPSPKQIIKDNKVFYVLEFNDLKLDKEVNSSLSSDSLELEFFEITEGKVFKKVTALRLFIESKNQRYISIKNREVLKNRAYEISFIEGDLVNFEELAQKEAIAKKQTDMTYHQLSIQANDMFYYDFSNEKTASEKFVDDLDPALVRKVINKNEYQRESFNRAESGNLYLIAEALVNHGYNDKALDAYRKAIEINPNNTEARLALAEHTTDAQEKVSNYIKTFDTTALLTVGQEWLKAGLDKSNSKVIEAALVAYQFSILKEPVNPKLRYEYGSALEKAGEDYYEDSAKRFLEAAAISKKKYLNGDLEIEDLMRTSIESLIKILSKQGEFNEASKYCKSYLALGFKKFMGGDPIMAIQKEINSKHNPF